MTAASYAQTDHGDIRRCLVEWSRAGRRIVHEADAKRILAAAGVPVPGRRPSGRFVVKLASDAFSHKSDHGLVRLGVASRDVPGVAEELKKIDPAGEVVVEDLIEDGVLELVVGCLTDRTFGPVVMLGLGGVLVELIDEVVFRLAPTAPEVARSMVAGGPIARLLAGVRGKPGADPEGVVDVIARISKLYADNSDLIAEIEINPLIVRPGPLGVVVADALLILKPGVRVDE